MHMSYQTSFRNQGPISMLPDRRPEHTEHAKMARWLIAENDWGTVSTTSIHLKGTAFG